MDHQKDDRPKSELSACLAPLEVASLTKEELDAELEKGYAAILEGRTRPASEVVAELQKKYGI